MNGNADDLNGIRPGDAFPLQASAWNRIRHIVYVRARQFRLSHEAAEDSASSFLLHLLEMQPVYLLQFGHEPRVERWVRMCAENWVRNTYKHEQAHAGLNADEDRDAKLQAIVSNAESPEQAVLRSELRTYFLAVASTLNDRQRDLFNRYYLSEQTIQEIAEVLHRQPNAVHQALWSLRARMRETLTAHGFTVVQANDYLCQLETHPCPQYPTCQEDDPADSC